MISIILSSDAEWSIEDLWIKIKTNECARQFGANIERFRLFIEDRKTSWCKADKHGWMDSIRYLCSLPITACDPALSTYLR